jgi:hypothetical protein
MCRSTAERPPAGKRCPGCTDPARQELARIRQRIGRYDRAARTANERGDWAALERYVALLDLDVAAYEHAADAAVGMPAAAVSRAGEFTPAATVDWSDDELMRAFGELQHDPAAQEQILATLDWRDELDRQRDAEIAAEIAAEEQRRRRDREDQERAWLAAEEDASPLTNPARRVARKLSPEQVCREEYDAHTYSAYLEAETACRGHLLTREAIAKGVHPLTLFSGPAVRARKYASEELRTWWARNGRITYAEWKYLWFGRESDKQGARTARHQSLGEAIA